MSIRQLYHPKQLEVLNFYFNTDFFMLIQHGAKRTGKTISNNDMFLMELARIKHIAAEEGVNEPQYILAGNTLGSLQRNVLQELVNKYGIEIKFDKFNRFKLFGVLVCCFGHGTVTDMSRIRGMTSYGAYINEGSTANEEVFNEIKSRCSATGARILVDTNPDHPEHWLYIDYILKADGKTIQEFHYELDDNTFLSERFKNNLKKSTPSGMFYDRDIRGLWVTAEGAVYKDFNKDIHYIHDLSKYEFVKYFCGVDWGYEHYGGIGVFGETADGKVVFIKEYSAQYEEIDYWVAIAKKIIKIYGNITFYCDSARPEHVARFKREGIKAKNANKAVLSGIEMVARRYKMKTLLIYYPGVNRFKKEIYTYVWNAKTGEPIKENDDIQDLIRYAIYTEYTYKGGVQVLK